MMNYEKLKELKKLMADFYNSYDGLKIFLDNDGDEILHKLKADSYYPFNERIDDMYDKITDWIFEVQREIDQPIDIAEKGMLDAKNRIAKVDYRNEGGGCMVLVYKFVHNGKPMWCYTNEEGCSIATCDYLSDADWYEHHLYEAEDVTIENHNSQNINEDSEHYWLMYAATLDFNKRIGGDC